MIAQENAIFQAIGETPGWVLFFAFFGGILSLMILQAIVKNYKEKLNESTT